MDETKAYRGPNGWYTAMPDYSGTHCQPADGGHMRESAARAMARAYNDYPQCQNCGTLGHRADQCPLDGR